MSAASVIVVGSGGAGLSAALEARSAGAHVTVLEAGPRAGGSTALSSGVFYACNTRQQRDKGINDSVDSMFEYYMCLNQWKVEPRLARRLCEDSAAGINWLTALGVNFPAEGLYCSGVESIPRGHKAEGYGAAIFEALYNAAGSRGIDIHNNIRVEGLVLGQSGRVSGVRAQGADMTADAVIIASGGFGCNQDLLQIYFPRAAWDADWNWYIGVQTNRGDGLVMARDIGAAIVGQDRGSLVLHPNFMRQVDPFLPSWLVFVNVDGRRFVDETASYSVIGDLVSLQPQRRCFAILDEETRRFAKSDRSVSDPHNLLGAIASNWVGDTILEQSRLGRVHCAQTLEELGLKAGIYAPALVGTSAAYSADADTGRDSHFLKPGPLRPIRTPPFYAVEVRAATIGMTFTGLRIDTGARVLGRDERPIAGLYAAGEVTGGVLGDRYVGGGNSIANAIVFGRIAGQHAVRDLAALGPRQGVAA